MSEIDPEFLKELQAAFVIEGREQLQSFMASVINLEASSDDKEKLDLAESMLHDLHSLKGNSRAAGITVVESICQSLESALLSLRRKNELLKPEAADIFHDAIDLLDDLMNKVESGTSDYMPEDFTAVLAGLKGLDERQKMAVEQSASVPAAQSAAQEPAPEPRPAGKVEAQAPKEEAASTGGKSRSQAPGADKSGTTRIALWKLDKLLREAEEMLILKQISEQHLQDIAEMRALARLVSQECQRLSTLVGSTKARGFESIPAGALIPFAQSLKAICKEMDQTITGKGRRQQTEQRLCFNMVDGFIDSVKSMLMLDFGSLLSLVPKVVRDLARELKKDVDLEIFGSEIEIDRRILEEIKDPLIHLVRNSLDHGIETGEERLEAGKPARALLRIGASHDESGHVLLTVVDDGRGISSARLRASAVREGAITAEEAQNLSEAQALELMYRSSVSTSETVTEISGRGIGMAIVRERIQSLGGRVFVETTPCRGTTFTLQLPTKLSTFRGIQVLAGEQTLIIPTLHVNYAGRILCSEIKQTGSRNLVSVSGQLISVQALVDVLHIDVRREARTRTARHYQQLIVLEAGSRRAGFLVDEILHEHEVLVRGLSYPLCRVANIAGATILGSGQVVPVLNTVDLLESAGKSQDADEKLSRRLDESAERERKLLKLPVFLVDRHQTSLVMLKSFLESEGYAVRTYESSETAFSGLRAGKPLVLLKNSELPETPENGLACRIRRDGTLKDLPIIFFGSDRAAEGEKLAKEQGADAYFSKLEFDRKEILSLIERLT